MLIEYLLWAILAVVVFGFTSIRSTNPFAPWLTTIIVLLVVYVLGRLTKK
jgi:glycerol uptake facilitator-like aquaporin